MQQKIIGYFKEIASEKDIEIDNSTDLFESGVLDSMEIIVFLTFLNEELQISIEYADLDFENFKSINLILDWISNHNN